MNNKVTNDNNESVCPICQGTGNGYNYPGSSREDVIGLVVCSACRGTGKLKKLFSDTSLYYIMKSQADEKTMAILERYGNKKVVCEHTRPLDNDNYQRWIGKHKNVHYWVELENNIAIALNENPAIGFSYPIKRIMR